jgi:endonuclease/exonuclease/phosphatase (EEP) superfamily protein YafD
MKSFNLLFIALTALLTLSSAQAYNQRLDQNVFTERRNLRAPIPADNDVILTLGKPSKKQLPPKNWSFLVWNLHKGEDETFKPEFMALSLGRDIIMNQEVYLDENMTDIFRFLLPYKIETATSFLYGKEKIRTGVANISTVEPISSLFIRTEIREPVLKSPKITLVTSYPIRYSNKKLTIVNIHGINFVSSLSYKKEMERIYQQIKDIPAPLVFAGDFNTWNEDRVRILDEYTQKLNLKAAIFLPDHRITFNGNYLDHFFHTNDIKITEARVDVIYKGSDHRPLTVEVEYIRLNDEIFYVDAGMQDKDHQESL